MATTPRQRFAEEHNMPLGVVNRLVALGNSRAQCAERECNGDPHPSVSNQSDKNANAEAWGVVCEKIQRQLVELVAPFGFTVDFGVGLYPHLTDAKGRYVHIPY